MTSDSDLAWAAGIIEGEGSVRINAPTRQNWGALIVAVTSTDEDMLAPLVECTRPECKDAWRWTVASRQAAAALVAVRPYCRVARVVAKIDLALEFQAQKVVGPLSRDAAYKQRQLDYFATMKQLNLRGAA